MLFSGINYLAVIAATVGAFVAGSVYYGALSKPWMKAAGIGPEDANMSPILFAITFACELVMAWLFAGLIGHLGFEDALVSNAVITAFFVWAGFVMIPMIINHRYGGRGWDLTLIDGGHWLLVLIVMAIILGWIGV